MITPENKQTMVTLLQEGKKFEAIRYANETFGVTLEQATILVEALENEVNHLPRRMINPASIVGKVFSGLGLVFLAVVSVLVWNDMKATNRSISVTGKVDRLEYNNSGGSVPVIKYRYLGRDREYMGTVWSTPPSFEVGEEVELLVDENNQETVTVNTFFERYFLVAFFSLFAIVFGGVGLLVLRFMRK